MSKPIGYTVKINQYCDHSEHSSEEYGSWSESYSNSFESIEKSKGQYADIYSPVNLDNQEGFLVWVEYSTGDSFGSSDRGSVEPIALVSSMDHSLQLEKQIQDWTDKKKSAVGWGTDSDYNFKTTIDNQEIKIFAPWLGYFESLDSINIESIAKK